MKSAVLVDAGALAALLDKGDRNHPACKAALVSIRAPLATVWPVISKACGLLKAVSPRAQADLLDMLESGVIGLLELDQDDIPRVRELMAKYKAVPMDLAHASLVRAAEREGLSAVLTTDAEAFRRYRPAPLRALRLPPR